MSLSGTLTLVDFVLAARTEEWRTEAGGDLCVARRDGEDRPISHSD